MTGQVLIGAAALGLGAALLDVSSAAAQTLRGRVLEQETSAPLAGAEVALPGGGARVVTDSLGQWQLALPDSGARTLRARRIGYAPATLGLPAGAADSMLVIRLSPLALPLDEVVVTAARREQRLADVTVTTEVVGRETLDATGASDLSEALTEQTGIQFDGGHPAGAGVMLQGLSNERVLVLVDGQPLYGRISGTLDLARIPTALVERVEVVKGPQASLYGSEAMGGVVNVVTRGPGPTPLAAGGRLVAGSGGRFDGGVTAEGRSGALSALADVGRRRVDRAPGRAAETGALAERFDGSARVLWRRDSVLGLEASALVLDERQRWPAAGLFEFADNVQVSGRLAADWRPGAHRLRSTLYLSQFDHLSRRSSVSQPIAGTGDRQNQRLVEAELLYGGTLFRQPLDAGVELRQERISSTDGRIEGGTRTLWSAEPFAQLEWTGGRWSVVPGVRLSYHERWGSAASPRLAVRWRAGETVSLRAGVGRGYRTPDFKELYLQFINDAAGYAVYGNEDLRPERSTNLTAGAEWTGVRLYARGQLFHNDLADFIETRAEADDGSGLLRFRYANVGRARTYGAELEGGWVLPLVRLEAGYAWLGTEDRATGRSLLGRPTHSGRLVATAGSARSLRVTLSGIYTGATPMERDDTGAITSEREGFFRLDARLARRLPAGLELSLGADNLFNRRPDEWADAVGRQWYVGLTWLSIPRP
jgi:outer membrane receptor for ferrienterochelin and colicins